jgi:hypothetical protein
MQPCRKTVIVKRGSNLYHRPLYDLQHFTISRIFSVRVREIIMRGLVKINSVGDRSATAEVVEGSTDTTQVFVYIAKLNNFSIFILIYNYIILLVTLNE